MSYGTINIRTKAVLNFGSYTNINLEQFSISNAFVNRGQSGVCFELSLNDLQHPNGNTAELYISIISSYYVGAVNIVKEYSIIFVTSKFGVVRNNTSIAVNVYSLSDFLSYTIEPNEDHSVGDKHSDILFVIPATS